MFKTLLYTLLASPFVLGLCALVTLIQALVLRQLWSWFVTPAFGLPLLAIPTAIGIALLWAIASPYRKAAKTLNSTDPWAELKSFGWVAFARPLLILSIGYIVQKFL